MQLLAQLTVHALQRVEERLHLTVTDIVVLLNAGRTVEIGRGRKTKHLHRLFYSERDDAWFVAVQDDHNGEVITILPWDYNPWAITPVALAEAKRLILDLNGPSLLSTDKDKPKKTRATCSVSPTPISSKIEQSTPAISFVRVGCSRFDKGGLTHLGKYHTSSPKYDIDNLVRDPAFSQWVQQAFARTGRRGKINKVFVAIGRNGEYHPFTWPLQ